MCGFSFNSILVRLKGFIWPDIRLVRVWFQFHTGSIKRKRTLTQSINFINVFQFHTGSIKSSALPLVCCVQIGFNSILVRLKGMRIHHVDHLLLCFNSILVRLKANRHNQINSHVVCFNSILVRLKVQTGRRNAYDDDTSFNSILVRLKVWILRVNAARIAVSIPYWFD